MERKRPRAKHRSMKKRESVPSHISTSKKDMSRPRPSLKLMKHRISSSHPTKKSIRLIQSKSPESKEELPLIPTNIPNLNISSTSPKSNNNSSKKIPNNPKNDDILTKLTKIKQHQKTRKSELDYDEIKQFIHDQNTTSNTINPRNDSINYKNTNNNNNNNLPTSLKLIGIRNPSALFYHRQFDKQYIDPTHHYRTQSNIVSVNTNKTVSITPKISNNAFNVNDKYNHLRSYSSIMSDNNVDNSKRNDSVMYVKNAKNRQPSEIFTINNQKMNGNNNYKRTKSKKEILQELADEYESESDDENNQDDDLKRDK